MHIESEKQQNELDGLSFNVLPLTVLLNRSGCSIFVECTFGDSWENFNHWIRTILLIHVGIFDDVSAVSEKTSAEEFVNHDDVDNL